MTGTQPGAGTTILLVEDEEGTRRTLAATLRTEGYTVLEAADGPSAERLTVRVGVPPALLITDYVMPGMNGHQLAESLRGRYPGMRVLIISAHVRDDEAVQKGILEEAFRSGSAFLEKPFSSSDLLRRVRAVLAGSA
jgi:CheY-like chemotaxis protein